MHPIAFHENRKHGTTDFPAEYYYVDSSHPRYNMSFHWHKEWELIRVIEGRFVLHADEEEITAEEGDILLIRDGMLHGGVPENCIYECFVFDLHGLFRSSELIKNYLRPIYRMKIMPDIVYVKNRNSALRVIVCEIMGACAERSHTKNNHCELAILGGLCSLFSFILRNKLYTLADENSVNKTSRIIRIKTALEYIEQKYQSEISLDELADVVGMNPKYFCRVFKEYTQQTPMEYVISYRIEQAAVMLTNTSNPIMDVALECGFNDCSYFIRTFKRIKGVTPSQYRKMNPEYYRSFSNN